MRVGRIGIRGAKTPKTSAVLVVLATMVCLFAAAGIASGFELTNVTPLFTTADNLGGAPSSLSLDGTTLVAGTHSNDGLVTVFEDADGWNTEQVLTPPAPGNGFGGAVDVFGDVLAAADQTSSTRDGAVHVFRKTGTWDVLPTIAAPTSVDGCAGLFGHSVALGPDLLAIGAPNWFSAPCPPELPGGQVIDPAVFLYEFDGANWVPNGFLQPSAAQSCGPTSYFGFDLDLVGNVLVVGAALDAIDSCPGGGSTGEGSVSVWVDSSGSWTQSGPRLRARDPNPDDHFGSSVATSGSAVLVGAPSDDEVGTNSGAAYLFELIDGAWTQSRKLTAADGLGFGSSVAVSDTGAGLRAVVGSESTNAVYVFERSPNGVWTETRIDLAGLGYPLGSFGQSVAAEGSLVAIGGLDMDPQAFVIDSPVVVPQPVDDTYSMAEDATLSAAAGAISPDPAGVLDNDSDPRGDGLMASLVSDVSNGTLSLDPDGSFVYAPDPNFNGDDGFVYQACDPDGICAPADVAINVAPVPDLPVAADDSAQTMADTPISIDVLANDSDPDLDPLSIAEFDNTSANAGTIILTADAELLYSPPAGFAGVDTFGYTVSDGDLTDSAVVTVTVESAPDPPSAEDDDATTPEETAVVIDVLANDSDSDGTIDPTSVAISTPPASGGVLVQSGGSVLYTPDPDFNGSDDFQYQICDNDGMCDTAFVSVTVTPVNDPPVAADDVATTAEEVAVTIPVLTNDSAGPPDEDQQLQVTIITVPASGTVVANIDGTVTYTPNPGFGDSHSFTYDACDSDGICDTATITVTVEANSQCLPGATEGDDVLLGTPGPDLICGLAGNDTIDGLGGDDVILGGSGNDVIDGGAGNDTIDGLGGDDVILGGSGNDVIDGGAGNDTIDGLGGDDVILGGSGNDVVDGGAGNDVLHGEDGHDRLIGGSGNDHLDGGANAFVLLADGWRDPNTGDRASYGGAPNGVTVNLDAGTASGWGNDTLAGIENVFGSARSDVLVGDEAPNVLFGWSGSDTISSGAGMDRIFGGDDAGSSDSGDTISGGSAGDWIEAGSGADNVTGDQGVDKVTGNQGADRILGGQGNDDLQGNDGNDELIGGVGDDQIFGFAGGDHLWGEEGNDDVFGGAGNDRLYGGSGTDVLGGGDGNDRLWATAPGATDGSPDALNGNPGNNTCVGSLSVDSFFNCRRVIREPD